MREVPRPAAGGAAAGQRVRKREVMSAKVPSG